MKEVIIFYYTPHPYQEHKEEINSLESLKKRINAIPKQISLNDCSNGVIIEKENNSLCIGLVSDMWCLILSYGIDISHQFYSYGELVGDKLIPIYWEQWHEVSNRSLIPKKQAWEAVKYWLETGKPSPLIRWTDEVL